MRYVNTYEEKNECRLAVVGVVRMSFYIGESHLDFLGLYRRKPFNSFPYLFPYLLLTGLLCKCVLQSVPPLSLVSFSSLIEVHLRNKNCIYFRGTMWHFDTCIHCEMITTTRLITDPSPHIVMITCVCVWWGHFRSTLLTNFKYII